MPRPLFPPLTDPRMTKPPGAGWMTALLASSVPMVSTAPTYGSSPRSSSWAATLPSRGRSSEVMPLRAQPSGGVSSTLLSCRATRLLLLLLASTSKTTTVVTFWGWGLQQQCQQQQAVSVACRGRGEL